MESEKMEQASAEMEQTTTDLLMQEIINNNLNQENILELLTSVQSMKDSLPKSIEDVIFPNLKKIQDTATNWLESSKKQMAELQEKHETQMSERKLEFYKEILEYKSNTEILLRSLKQDAGMAIADKCELYFKNSELSIQKILNKFTGQLKVATGLASKLMLKNLLLSFAASFILLVGAIGGLLYIQNYKDGTQIAEQKAEETLASERKKIEQDAIEAYKKSGDYKEDACKLVAENITKLEYLHYLHKYIRSDDIKSHIEVRDFYNSLLKEGNKQYKENKK